MEIIFQALFIIGMAYFAYMSCHVVEEKKRGKYIPLPWEKDGFFRKTKKKIFDKANIQYRDGDNT